MAVLSIAWVVLAPGAFDVNGSAASPNPGGKYAVSNARGRSPSRKRRLMHSTFEGPRMSATYGGASMTRCESTSTREEMPELASTSVIVHTPDPSPCFTGLATNANGDSAQPRPIDQFASAGQAAAAGRPLLDDRRLERFGQLGARRNAAAAYPQVDGVEVEFGSGQ